MNTENKALTFDEYQEKAMSTCMPTCNNFGYMMLNLIGEMGEFSSKVAKAIRKGKVNLEDNKIEDGNEPFILDEEWENFENELKLEAGDIFWQLFGLCSAMEWNAEDIARMNLRKLSARKVAGTIDGNGDGISGTDRTK